MARSRLLATTILGAMVAAGCPGESPIAGKSVESMTLYSIDSDPTTARGFAERAGPLFHGYRVLGMVDVLDRKTRSDLMDRFEAAAAVGGEMAKCVCPRQGFRILRKGKTIDHVICFHCNEYLAHEGVEPTETRLIDGSAKKTFNAILKRAGIPLASEDSCN